MSPGLVSLSPQTDMQRSVTRTTNPARGGAGTSGRMEGGDADTHECFCHPLSRIEGGDGACAHIIKRVTG